MLLMLRENLIAISCNHVPTFPNRFIIETHECVAVDEMYA